jgi:GntR family transcriptional regulator, gluconate operon transcriptional repressor
MPGPRRSGRPPVVTLRGADRRRAILDALADAVDAVPGDELARRFGVSRQAIVQDVAVLRAQGSAVFSTVRGYLLDGSDAFPVRGATDDRRRRPSTGHGVGRETPSLERLSAPSLAELAYQSVRDSVLTGRFPAGSRLPDARLADDLGISRGTVRQALARLVEEGLVVDVPRRGAFVRRSSPADLIELYNVRVAIEPVAARLIVRSRVAIESLRSLLETTGTAYASGDVATILEAESAFHTELVTLGGNTHLADLYRAARARFRMAISVTQLSLEPDLRVSVDDHPTVVAALETGDEAHAARAVHWHIVENVDEALRRLGADPSLLLPPL